VSKPQPKLLDDHPLVVSFEILQMLGEPGQRVWANGKHIKDVEERVAYLTMAILWLKAKIREKDRLPYRELPVDFRTFCESDDLLKKRGVLWPEVIRCGAEINSGRYVEAVLTGGIGVAKTTLAIYSQAYQVYILSCLENPHVLFDLDPSSEILIVFQSINKNLAKDVDYKRFRDMINGSPYFTKEFPFDTSRESDMQFERNIIVKPVSGQDTAAIGQNVIGGVIDEVNFMALVENSKQTRGDTYDQAAANYNSIARRRESRFMQMGTLPGMLCLVSSRNYPGGLTDRKEAEARTNKHIYVYDKRIWELRPERFAGEKFRVFVGDETRKPRILEDEDVVPVEDESLVQAIPVEYRGTFDNDLLAALRDVAGVSTLALHPFMLNTDAVVSCFGKVQSIASREDCDFKSTKVQLYPLRIVNPQEPRFAHIDLALTKDSAGLTIGHVPGFKHMQRGDYQETLPIVQLDLILEVKPPRGGEIEFENIRALIYKIRDQLKVPIKWVSFDQYQSKDSMQIMHQNGFIVGYQSMDIDTEAYDVTKQAFYDSRIIAPAHAKAQKEMITLEMDTKKNKIDHPPQGSKDVSDSLAGVVFGLTMRREIWLRHQIPLQRIPKSLTERGQTKDSLSSKEREKRQPGETYLEQIRRVRGVDPKGRQDDQDQV
jgi:hypothetical protein